MKKKKLNVLVACEESQAVTKEILKLNKSKAKIFSNWEIVAFSCDLLPCSGGLQKHHLQQDVFDVIATPEKFTGKKVKEWDLMIAHPPCTYLAVSGAQWYYHPEDKHLPTSERRPHPKYPNRRTDRKDAINFVKKLAESPIKHKVIENPIGVLSTQWRKPDQIVQPFMFGDEARKTTCFWIENLEKLKLKPKEKWVSEGERTTFGSGKSMPKWYSDAFVNAKTPEERRTLRSKTFPGMARAMATQWVAQIIKQHN